MLNQNCKIQKGIVGLDPDKEEDPQLKSWFKKHPIKRQISEAEKEILRKRFKNSIKVKK